MNPFAQFILRGHIEGIFLGMTRSECEARLGLPKDWKGKPPTFGEQVYSPRDATVWFYFEKSIGVHFGNSEHGPSLILFPEHMDKSPIFSEWPIGSTAMLGQFRDALNKEGIEFIEADPNDVNYWIISEGNCAAFGAPFCDGRQIHGPERRIGMIQKVRSLAEAKRIVGA
jgi:hypothetical protein